MSSPIIEPDATRSTIVVVDDDESVRDALRGLFRSVGLRAETYDSVLAFVESGPLERVSCLVLDIRLPGGSGLDFQEEMVRSGIHIPIIFISGHADVPVSVLETKAGAVEFLAKPVREQELLDAVNAAIRRH